MEKIYHLRILDGSSRGYTISVTSDRVDSYQANYHFYNIVDGYKVDVAFYPSGRTIIERIEDGE